MKNVFKIFILINLSLMFFSNVYAIDFGEEIEAYQIGDVVKNFTLVNGLTKKEVSFSKEIKGKNKVTVLIFMTTTCSACKAEMVLLSEFFNEYELSEGLSVYAISVDIDGENTVPKYNEEYGFNVTYLLDPDFTTPQLFGFIYTPGLVLLDRTGEVIYLKGGYSPFEAPEVLEALKAALR